MRYPGQVAKCQLYLSSNARSGEHSGHARLSRQELKVKKKARKINGLQTLEGRIYTQFTRKIKMFFGLWHG